MASSAQHEKNEEIAVQLSLEEKASLDEIIKQAELSLQSQEVLNQSLAIVAGSESLDEAAVAGLLDFVAVAGASRNQTKGPLTVLAEKTYAGYLVKNFTNPIEPVSTGFFGTAGKDSTEAAVVYYGKNKAGVDSGWLLGFIATKDVGKVYVESGKKAKYININWGDIKTKIEHGNKYVYYSDKDTGTSVIATIQGKSGKYALAAAFLG